VGEIVAFVAFAGLLIGMLDQVTNFVTAIHRRAPVLQGYFALVDAAQGVIERPDAQPLPEPVRGDVRYAKEDGSPAGPGEIGEILRARLVAMLIGERPGLSAPDSLGAYLTYDPRVGRTDAERNCVSNIHGSGLGSAEAAFKIAWLVREAIARQVTGVALKDESAEAMVARLAKPV
jgi:hypothetical protein